MNRGDLSQRLPLGDYSTRAALLREERRRQRQQPDPGQRNQHDHQRVRGERAHSTARRRREEPPLGLGGRLVRQMLQVLIHRRPHPRRPIELLYPCRYRFSHEKLGQATDLTVLVASNGWPERKTAHAHASNLRAAAIKANFLGLPRSTRCW